MIYSPSPGQAPDDFDPANPYKDPVAMLEMREHIVREKWIQIEKAKILLEKLRWCYSVEGINHLQKSLGHMGGVDTLVDLAEFAKGGAFKAGDKIALVTPCTGVQTAVVILKKC